VASVPDVASLAKAQLVQLDASFDQPIAPETWCTVQFNPESLKVSYSNQLEKPPGSGDQRGPAAMQVVGTSATKLSLTLWFDVGSSQGSRAAVDDVRVLTKEVAFFITPGPPKSKRKTLPAVRFVWGSFLFDGLMDSLEESLEYFSPEGKPLRASVSVSLSRQEIVFDFNDASGAPGGKKAPQTPGTTPLVQAAEGSTVQGLADAAGAGQDWQSIAAANGIENPRLLAPGTLLRAAADAR
jgi:hypothetical protein